MTSNFIEEEAYLNYLPSGFPFKPTEVEMDLNSLPPGFRFKPTDVQLVDYYLKRKVNNQPLPPSKIREVQLYNYDPETLTGISDNKSSNGSVDEWYFFTPRDRKYKNGKRPGRAAGDGYWKATGADKVIKSEGNIVGSKKTLVFVKGKPPKGDKTNWIMHEFVLRNPPARKRNGDDDMRLDDWVLCRLYKKQNAKSEPRTLQQGDDEEQEEAADANIPDQTETRIQEYHGIPPPQPEQFQANDFNVVPQQNFPMPSYNPSAYGGPPQFRQCYNAYHDSASGGLLQSPDPRLQHYSTIIPGQAVSDYGNFMPRVAPMSSMPPAPISSMPPAQVSSMPYAPVSSMHPDQFHWIHQRPQRQFPSIANNF